MRGSRRTTRLLAASAVDITGAVLTKMDGDSRGGAALSIKEVGCCISSWLKSKLLELRQCTGAGCSALPLRSWACK